MKLYLQEFVINGTLMNLELQQCLSHKLCEYTYKIILTRTRPNKRSATSKMNHTSTWVRGVWEEEVQYPAQSTGGFAQSFLASQRI